MIKFIVGEWIYYRLTKKSVCQSVHFERDVTQLLSQMEDGIELYRSFVLRKASLLPICKKRELMTITQRKQRLLSVLKKEN